jgi:hypothetical protein
MVAPSAVGCKPLLAGSQFVAVRFSGFAYACPFSSGESLRLLNPTADSEDVSVWVPDVHLANIPRHVGWRPGDLKTLRKAPLVDSVDVVDPDRHPHASVGRIIAFRAERLLESALAATALRVLAQKDLTLARAHPPNVAGLPQSQPFCHPSFSNQAKLS